jgi:hypothetical protein
METIDGAILFAATDTNNGQNPNVVAVAYSNNFAGATTTTLYGIDSGRDILVNILPPNNGTLNTVGPLQVDITDAAGFDIDATGEALAVLTPAAASTSSLYSINLMSGQATLIGEIGGGTIGSMTIAP